MLLPRLGSEFLPELNEGALYAEDYLLSKKVARHRFGIARGCIHTTNRRFRKMIQGQPTLLIHNGQIIPAHMAKEHVSMDELERALREHSISSCHEVALGVLEVDGSISCLKYDELNPASQNHPVRRKYLQKHQ